MYKIFIRWLSLVLGYPKDEHGQFSVQKFGDVNGLHVWCRVWVKVWIRVTPPSCTHAVSCQLSRLSNGYLIKANGFYSISSLLLKEYSG